MKKNVIESGLNGLLNPQTPAQETPQEPKETGNYKIVCYNLRTDIVEKLDYIAYWDRKKKNAAKPSAARKPRKRPSERPAT